jgi:subtilase family serine protease
MHKRFFFVRGTEFVFLALAFGFGSQALAVHLHRTIPSSHKHTKSLCVYPDGSTPAGQPELHCYDPATFMQAYGVDQVHQMGLTGKGQTIIFVDSFGSPTLQADLDHFSETFGLPKTQIEFIYPNGPYVNPVDNEDKVGWAQETTLDLEWGHAMAPGAKLVNIVSNSSETVGMNGMQDLFNGIRLAIQKYPNAIISMSFATSEATFSASDVKTFLQGSLHQTFVDATSAGFTLLAGAGDTGSTNIDSAQTSLLNYPNTNFPASDPLVTAIGGTSIQYHWRWNPQGTADDFWACEFAKNAHCPTDFFQAMVTDGITESVWNEPWAVAAGGGGVSTVFKTPDFQSGLDEKLTNGYRVLPDLSLNAAINGGVDVYTSFNGPSWQVYGGTSCATPETAGLVALAGELASQQLGKTVGIGNLNPILYSLNSDDFNDIVPEVFGENNQVTIDNNAMFFSSDALATAGPKAVPPKLVQGYATGKGFDLATGFGSPRAAKFVVDVARARVARE